MRATISEMERRLQPEGFARIHRSRLVNVSRIKELSAPCRRSFSIVLAQEWPQLEGQLSLLESHARAARHRDLTRRFVVFFQPSSGRPLVSSHSGSVSRYRGRESRHRVQPTDVMKKTLPPMALFVAASLGFASLLANEMVTPNPPEVALPGRLPKLECIHEEGCQKCGIRRL